VNESLLCCVAALSKGLYKVVGTLMAYSIVHGGPLPKFLDEKLYYLLCSNSSAEITVNVADIYDATLRQRLTDVIIVVL